MNEPRPISVISVLLRVTERLAIHKYVMLYIDCDVFLDQYAFKPTGSTACATVDITHRISLLLESCSFAQRLFIDCSKAFDTFDHLTLIHKLEKFLMP
jgi:Reverse transcriptase (RNA-dependent DNA polymerase)